MGCDIHCYTEKKDPQGKWHLVETGPFSDRNYGLFGFLADVRNYSETVSLQNNRGLPKDVSESVLESYREWGPDAHSAGWLLLKELLDFDYNQKFYNMRVYRDGNGAARARSLKEAEHISYREFLSLSFVAHLDHLSEIGNPEDVRIVFWFDN